MLLIVFYIIFIMIFLASPLLGKLILLVINLFIPDPIPYIDEVIMSASTLHNLSSVISIWENHKGLVILGVIVGIIILFVIL